MEVRFVIQVAVAEAMRAVEMRVDEEEVIEDVEDSMGRMAAARGLHLMRYKQLQLDHILHII